MQITENTVATARTLDKAIPDSLTIFSYAWAAQSLFQLAFYPEWFEHDLVLGWIFFFLSISVLLFPGRFRLFAAMLVSGIAYYFSIWPFVVNHVLVDPILSTTMLAALAVLFGRQLLNRQRFSQEDAEAWFLKFAPVLGVMFAFVYISIIISKLNVAFFDLEISCLTGMIESQDDRPLIAPLLSLFSVRFLFWFFIVAETALPIMLLFRRTRLAAFYFGVPFHLLLGLMGHWPFSSFMLPLYALVCMPTLKGVVRLCIERLDATRHKRLPWLPGTAMFAIANVLLLCTAVVGKSSWTWLLWSSVLSAAILYGVLREHCQHGLFGGTGVIEVWTKHPGWLWVMLVLIIINSSGPYTGWKTQTSIAMYSNLRTEGDINNHFFMPAVPIFDFQKDLVEVIDSNNDEILKLKTHPARYGFIGKTFEVYQIYFQFRRAISTLEADDLEVTYRRNGELITYRRGADGNVDANLDVPPPLILSKLLYFRPVFKGEKSYCLH